jgi:hypothetical protein
MVWQRLSRFRTSASSFLIGTMNVTIAAGFGFISGHYMFKEPLEAYWSEQRQKELEAAESAAKDPSIAGTTSPASATASSNISEKK